jgi:hypothetical protein
MLVTNLDAFDKLARKNVNLGKTASSPRRVELPR